MLTIVRASVCRITDLFRYFQIMESGIVAIIAE